MAKYLFLAMILPCNRRSPLPYLSHSPGAARFSKLTPSFFEKQPAVPTFPHLLRFSFLADPCDNLSLVAAFKLNYCPAMIARWNISSKGRSARIRRQIGALVALLAILLNFALPVSHSAAAAAAAADKDGYVEICTGTGIRLVAQIDAAGHTDSASHMDEDCAQCVACPLCQIQSSNHVLALPSAQIIALADLRTKVGVETARNKTDRRSGYDQPLSRAPPLT